jgi:archaellin
VTVQVVSSASMFVDTPRPGATVTSGFTVSGWAIDAAAPSGTGVDAVHVWAYPAAGGSPVFLGANAVWVSRPDVGAIFGSAFTSSGFNIATGPLASGSWNVVVFARSTVTGTFSQSVLVPVRIP